MTIEEEKRLHRVCFTGHRPEKLTRSERLIKRDLEKEIKRAINNGFTTFITGMARGTDIWAAEIVLELKDKGKDIKLICASPYHGFEKCWGEDWRQRYKTIFSKADYAFFVSMEYSRSCFQVRNEWMVNHSSRVIAVYNGERGGTMNTIEYAAKKQIPVEFVKG